MSAPPQVIASNPHTNLLNVYVYIYIYIKIANKMGVQQKETSGVKGKNAENYTSSLPMPS
jgi:hypothetical protein